MDEFDAMFRFDSPVRRKSTAFRADSPRNDVLFAFIRDAMDGCAQTHSRIVADLCEAVDAMRGSSRALAEELEAGRARVATLQNQVETVVGLHRLELNSIYETLDTVQKQKHAPSDIDALRAELAALRQEVAILTARADARETAYETFASECRAAHASHDTALARELGALRCYVLDAVTFATA